MTAASDVVKPQDGASPAAVPMRAECPFCCSGIAAATSKCPSCGEWIRWTPRRVTTAVLTVIAVVSLPLTVYELQRSSRLQQLAAIQRLNDLYKTLDLYLVEHPELSAVIAPREDYQFTIDALAREGGPEYVRQINFAAYVLGLLEEERRLRTDFDVDVFSDDEFLIPVLSNPNVARWWEDPGLKHWYPDDFREHVDGVLTRLKQANGTP